jgi:hypothetical protein
MFDNIKTVGVGCLRFILLARNFNASNDVLFYIDDNRKDNKPDKDTLKKSFIICKPTERMY